MAHIVPVSTMSTLYFVLDTRDTIEDLWELVEWAVARYTLRVFKTISFDEKCQKLPDLDSIIAFLTIHRYTVILEDNI